MTVNRDHTMDVYTSNAANEYTQVVVGSATQSVSYDDNCNLSVDQRGYRYYYDYENRLTQIDDVSYATVAEYTYDALGRRIKTVVHGTTDVTRYYFYDGGWRVLAESDENKTLKRDYIYGNYLDEVLYVRDLTVSEDYYYAHDHLYSPVALLEDDGTILERYEYDAYGRLTAYTDDGADDTWFTGDDTVAGASARGNVIAFTGQRLDVLDGGDLELMYYKNRYYDGETGRFLTRDPIGYADGMNLYQYVQSSPVMSMDAIGHRTETKVRSNNDPRYGPIDRGGVKKPFDPKQCMVMSMICMVGSTGPCCSGGYGIPPTTYGYPSPSPGPKSPKPNTRLNTSMEECEYNGKYEVTSRNFSRRAPTTVKSPLQMIATSITIDLIKHKCSCEMDCKDYDFQIYGFDWFHGLLIGIGRDPSDDFSEWKEQNSYEAYATSYDENAERNACKGVAGSARYSDDTDMNTVCQEMAKTGVELVVPCASPEDEFQRKAKEELDDFTDECRKKCEDLKGKRS